jgi:hypothetical protein
MPVAVPRIAAVIWKASDESVSLCQHEVQVTGSFESIKAVRRTLKQHGFLDKDNDDAWPLNGHWETDHGLTVMIEGKLVRWSRQRASRLSFAAPDRRSCLLHLYGSPARGQLVTPGLSPGATKSLRWDNGDTWHSFDGRIIGQAALYSQTMTKVMRDDMQDQAYRARSDAVLRCVSKSSLSLPPNIEESVMQFLGRNLHYVRICFESKWNPRGMDSNDPDADPFDIISRRNPRVAFRHCWAEPGRGCCGQRSLVNGDEVDEEIFNRHVKIVCTI